MPKPCLLLAPVGAALFLAFASLTPYHTLVEIGALMEVNHVVDLPDDHLIGEVGLVLFVIGFVCSIVAYDSSCPAAKKMVIGAAIAFALAVMTAGYGTWLLNAAFMGLATGESIDSELFMQEVRPAKYPLLAGWCFVFVGGILMCMAGWNSPRKANSLASHNLIFACFCGLVLVVAAIWSILSFQSTALVLQDPQIEPVRIAKGVLGLIRSSYLSLAGVAGCVFACVLSLGGSESNELGS